MPHKEVLLMRHGYDDHSFIDGLNDTSLTLRGIEEARSASQEYVQNLHDQLEAGLSLRISSKRRAIETAEIISEELSREKIEHDLVVDANLRELFQGVMIGLAGKTHEQRVRILELGWEIFDRERKLGNDDYKFGTPDTSSDRYVQFNTFIAPPYGESHNELARRVELAFYETLSDVVHTNQTPLFVVHRGTIREILNLSLAHNDRNYSVAQNPNIEMSGWRYCELFRTTVTDVGFSLGALKRSLGLDRE